MKTTTSSLSLLLAATLAVTAQDQPAVPVPPLPPHPPVEPANPAHGSLTGLPGGKVMITSGSGDTIRAEVLDFHGEKNADAPLSLKVHSMDPAQRPNGPVTFMGVAVSSAPKELATHLPLEQGMGLVVENVSKDSPAEKAGVQINDILTKLDDQVLIHPAQFSFLVARKKEGDSVRISLLRKGTVQELAVTLGKSDRGDSTGGTASLEIGDMKIQIEGGDTAPLRTIVKHLKLNGPAGESVVQIEGDSLKIDGDRIKAMGDATVRKVQDKLKMEEAKIREQSQAAMAAALRAIEQAKAVSAAAGSALKAKAKQEAIRQLEETLRKLKEE